MPQLNVSPPDGLKKFAASRVAEGRDASASDYIRDLLRQDQDRPAELRRLKAEVEMGSATPIDPRRVRQFFANAKARVESRAR